MSTFKVDNEEVKKSIESLKKLLDKCETAYGKSIPVSNHAKGKTYVEMVELCNNIKDYCYSMGLLVNSTILFLGGVSEMFEKSDQESASAISDGDATAGGGSIYTTGANNNIQNYDFAQVPVQTAGYGYCNMAAVANLLNRRNFVDGSVGNITYQEIYDVNGGVETDAAAQWTGKLKNGILNTYGYEMVYESSANIHNVDYMSELCKSHPEGILVYAQGTYPHGVVLSYQNNEWYLTDSAGTGYTKYEDSYMAKSNGLGTVESLLANAYNIYYVK